MTATFTLNQYPLAVVVSDTGGGSVSSDPLGINCGADCTESYDYGTVDPLTATAVDGSTFAGWQGACTNVTGDWVVTIDQAQNVMAIFTKKTYQLYLPTVIR